jgi:putative endonuclease
MKNHKYWVYIITNPNKTIIYIGVTNNLSLRLKQHYNNRGSNDSFAGKYYCYNLVYFEEFKYINKAIAREKQLKKWTRVKKDKLISSNNPDWHFKNAIFQN